MADLASLVSQIREIENAMGDGVKRVYESEMGPRQRLRRFMTPSFETTRTAVSG